MKTSRITGVSVPQEDAVWRAISYDPNNGTFVRRATGAVAGGKVAGGYIEIRIDGFRVYAHRVAWLMSNGNWPEGVIDHINGNKSDNRLSNLRDVSPSQNRANTLKPKGVSGMVGVSWHKGVGKWVARLTRPGEEQKYLGIFKTPQEARLAYELAKSATPQEQP